MNHEDASAALAAAALDALSAEEQAAVLEHAESCSTCGPELAELRVAMGSLSLAAPAVPPSGEILARLDRVRGRLLSRARADVLPPTVAHPSAGRGGPSAASGWLLAALAASFVVAAVLWQHDTRLARQLADARAAALSSHAALDSAATALAAAEHQLDLVTGPDVDVVSLTAAGARTASALMFWDRATNTWSMYARDLPEAPAGRTYELWLITSAGKKIPAGTFAPSPRGTAHVETTYTLDRSALATVAVTEEPAGGVENPTGPIIIAGSPAPAKR
jgi:anti-sigma-K factor RskA